MAEQNLVAVAAGLAKTGKIAYCTTYGVFATRRAYDFIAIACAHAKANVKIFAGLPGPHHRLRRHAPGDRGPRADAAIPDLTVIDPCDATEMRQVTAAIADTPGRSTCGCCAAASRSCSSGALPVRARQGARCCARAATSASSAPGS